MAGGKLPDDFLAILGIGKDGGEEPVEFILQAGLLPEQNLVDILFETQSFLKITQIVWDATEDHMTLYNIVPGQFNVLLLEEVFTLA